MREEYCMKCGIILDQPIPGILAEAWLVTDGNKDIIKSVPDGQIYGKQLGFVCNDCSAFNNKRKQ